jgi:N-methylhydantoinase A
LGLLTADVTRSFVRSIVLPTENIDIERINSFYHLFRTQGRQILLKEGIPNEDIYYQPSVDMRYRGQSYELNLTLQDCKLTEDGLAELEQRFHKEHERVYGHTSPGEPTELVNLRLVARGRVPKPSLEIETKGNLKEAKVGIRDAFFNGWVECEVFVRERLPVEVHLEGPAIIESEESTILLPPEKRAFTDRFGNLIIEVGR